MSHFGVLSHSGTGHLNPLMALSGQLTARGHRVTFFQRPELESRVRQQGLEFHPIDAPKFSSLEDQRRDVSDSSRASFKALRRDMEHIVSAMKKSLRDLPPALVQCGVEVLIVDEIVLAGPTVAQILHIPYFIVSTSVPLNFGWSVSHRSLIHTSHNSPWSWIQDEWLQVSVLHLHGPVRWRLDDFRRRLGLGPIRKIHKDFPTLAHIAQLPQCLDFSRSKLPPNFHYTGPFIDDGIRSHIEFPWHRLDGRPLVYMSLGTSRAVQSTLFRLVAEACNELNLQLVITLGGRSSPESLGGLPGPPVVVRNAPQVELVKRAEIVVTHSGLNTALETLREGKPILAIPIGYDQPAVADRLAWLGVAEVLPAKELTVTRAMSSLRRLLTDRSAALALQSKIRDVDGSQRAADVIEAALESHSAPHLSGSHKH